mmetsp:Transcript_107513/g.314332  ORF Transcript_107513/g.314332 Transcript_107513/m.314332 type:complete len:317 (-) Transcript_107513:174-1124(-)
MHPCNAALLYLTGALQVFAPGALTVHHDGDPGWLRLPPGPTGGNASAAPVAVATYVGPAKPGYVDCAVLLGLSLQRHLPGVPRLCLAPEGLDGRSRGALAAAGWSLVDVGGGGGGPPGAGTCFSGTPCREFYNKMSVFRLPLDHVLWLDADTLVLNGGLRQVLLDTELPSGHIAMVKDCCRPVYNSGLMLFRPDLATFQNMRRMPMDKKSSDQDLINRQFAGKIVALDAKFNTHGYKSMSCNGVVVAHYTGLLKPTYPDAKQLELVRTGKKSKQQPKVFFNFQCDKLYKQYYCSLKESASYVSMELQQALAKLPPC